jgi:glycosyltransferase involved in cell wall biosynthesis
VRRLSVIIPNYNYRDYVAAAIDSALALEWDDVEVIVVDDGSTDDSVEVISAYVDRVTIIEQPNSGPRVACNQGFARSTGDVVIFLDSDDVLDPRIAIEIAAIWREGVSKIQVQMNRIDTLGASIGSVFPHFDGSPTPEDIRFWMEETSAYPTPPGSGNAYSKQFLEQLFPLDGRCGDATDSACLAAAPFMGDVLTIPVPLVNYRVHGLNRSNLLADPNRFTKQIDRAYQRHLFALEVSGRTPKRRLAALFRGRHLLQMRVSERLLVGGPVPIPSDGRLRMLGDSLTSIAAPGPESLRQRIVIACWCIAVLAWPRPLARKLIELRFGGSAGGYPYLPKKIAAI